jgi:hypothetical protein
MVGRRGLDDLGPQHVGEPGSEVLQGRPLVIADVGQEECACGT